MDQSRAHVPQAPKARSGGGMVAYAAAVDIVNAVLDGLLDHALDPLLLVFSRLRVFERLDTLYLGRGGFQRLGNFVHAVHLFSRVQVDQLLLRLSLSELELRLLHLQLREVEVREERSPAWTAAQVVVMLIDGQFQARIELPDGSDQWEDWFSWEDENADWRRKMAGKKRKSTDGTVALVALDVASPTDALPTGWTEEERTTANGRKYAVYHGPNGERAQSRTAAWRAGVYCEVH